MKKICFFIAFLWGSTIALGQEIQIFGQVKDSSGVVLSNANIIAFPNSNSEKTPFAITDKKGEYSLTLKKNITYEIQVSYLGFRPLVFSLIAENSAKKDFTLLPLVQELDEVLLTYKLPVQIKKDTTIYNVTAFASGKERKLKELLNKLPGIEVDREGNVRAQGKEITKVLVEGKTFFTGDSKLAVNNIPVDVIDQIEILDNYSAIGFLKGLEDSQEKALNIKLKEEKKRFVFGDIELGYGLEERYLAHPALFYYSPKTNVNIIGDLNNIGEKGFSITDYIDFEGGFGKLMSNNKNFVSLYNDDFASHLNNMDFKENSNSFGAFNLRQSISPTTEINSYAIITNSKSETETQTVNNYLADEPFIENRQELESNDISFLLGKLSIGHHSKQNLNISANTLVKLGKNDSFGSLISINPYQNNSLQTFNSFEYLDLKQNIDYNKKFSKAQTLSVEATLGHSQNKSIGDWISNESFLEDRLPLEIDMPYSINQKRELRKTSFDLALKDYWILNNYNHLYTTLGYGISFDNYLSSSGQALTDQDSIDFPKDSFSNDLDRNFNDIFIGLEYKFLIGKLIFKPGLIYHRYFWRNRQTTNIFTNSSSTILPQFLLRVEFNDSEKLIIKYDTDVGFPDTSQFSQNYSIVDFNVVTKGNPSMGPMKSHSLSLNYYKLNFFKGLYFDTSLVYLRRAQNIKKNVVLNGIDQSSTFLILYSPENSLAGNFNLSKEISNLKFHFQGEASYDEFFQVFNSEASIFFLTDLSGKIRAETYFEKGPNFEISYEHSPSNYGGKDGRTRYLSSELFVSSEFRFFDDFKFTVEYSKNRFLNRENRIQNLFDLANTSIYYNKENSPWSFEMEATNLFNVNAKRESSFSDFIVQERSIYIVPRIIMFKIAYKF